MNPPKTTLFSLLIMLCLGISVNAQNQPSTLFDSRDSVYMYHTLLDAYSFHFSGIMAIKKIDNTHRIIFSTETGSTLFDFTLTKNKCKANYVMKAMNNALFLALIKSDIKDLLQTYKYKKNYAKHVQEEVIKNETIEYNQSGDKGVIHSKEIYLRFSKHQEIKKIITFQFNSNEQLSESTITITHQNIPIKIEMDAFTNAEE
ncbi:MAG: hypothetical protein WCP57_05170 [Bacteroidota bacterium]